MHARILNRAKTSGRIDDNTEVFRKRHAAYLKDIPEVVQLFGDVIDVRHKLEFLDGKHSS